MCCCHVGSQPVASELVGRIVKDKVFSWHLGTHVSSIYGSSAGLTHVEVLSAILLDE